jgi:hypothetical protein
MRRCPAGICDRENVPRAGRLVRRSTSLRWAFTLVAGLTLTGCSSIAAQDTQPLTLEAWCGGQLADRCAEALVFLHWLPEQEACVVAVTDPTTSLFELCQASSPEPIGAPVTTHPTPDQIAEEELERRVFLEEELPLLDARIAETLLRTHPTDELTVGLVFAEPLTLPDMEAFIEDLGGIWVSTWRTDYVCGPESVGPNQASRFAFRDGVERASAARQAADQSQVPVTGRFLLEAAWAGMEHAAQAIREPGVLVEAVEALLPVEQLPRLEGEPKVRTVRIAVTPEEAGDLTDPPVPACEP